MAAFASICQRELEATSKQKELIIEVIKASDKHIKTTIPIFIFKNVNNHSNDKVNYELSVEEEYGKVYVVPCDNHASLLTFSDLIVTCWKDRGGICVV